MTEPDRQRDRPTDRCLPEASVLDPSHPEAAADARLAELAKALGHPARVTIIRLLARKSGCIAGDIAGELPLAQSTVSQHLKQLKAAGLIRGEVEGNRICYCLEPSALSELKALVVGL